MVLLSVQHRIKDYDLWKRVFDAFSPREGGAKFHRVNRMIGDPNMILVVAGFETEAQALAFRANPGLAEAMKRSGVVGEPRLELYEDLESIQY